MMSKTVLIQLSGSDLETIIFDCVDRAIKLNQNTTTNVPTNVAPIMSAKQVKDMTGWPPGTFYQKVSEMPEGVVIRGKSKRLLFVTERLLAYLKNPVQP